jgi:hypothetical protein
VSTQKRYLWQIDCSTKFLAERVGAFEVTAGQVKLLECLDDRLPALIARLSTEPTLELTYERTPDGEGTRRRVLTREAVQPSDAGYADALGQAITLETGLTFGLNPHEEPLF